MTLEQLGFVKELNSDKVLFRRGKLYGNYYEWVVFNLTYKEFDITNIVYIDMILLEAIYVTAKELFNE